MLAFAVQAIVSLLDDDGLADLPATTPDGLGIDEATDSVEPGASDTPADEQAELDAFVEAIAFIEKARRRDFLERPDVELVDVDTMTRIVLDDLESELAADPGGRRRVSRSPVRSASSARTTTCSTCTRSSCPVVFLACTSPPLTVCSSARTANSRCRPRPRSSMNSSTPSTINTSTSTALNSAPTATPPGPSRRSRGQRHRDRGLWRDSLSAAEQARLAAEEAAFEVGDIFSLDFGFLLYQTAVYDYGNTWLNRRIAEEGISAIDDAVANPASSSEAVIEAPGTVDLAIVDVPVPDVDGEVLWQGTGGQALLEAITVAVGGTPDTASGWGGDALSVYRDSGGRECLRWIIAMDTPRDRKELRAGLDQWAAGVGAGISDVGDWLRIDRCA